MAESLRLPNRLSAGQRPLFGLFVHYGLNADEAKNPNGRELERRLKRDLKYLNKLLEPNEGWQGFAFVFIDVGWVDILAHTGRPIDHVKLAEELGELTGGISRKLKQRIKLITFAKLAELLEVLEKILPKQHQDKLWRYLTGEKDKLLYDAPKVIEAAIRIANIGRQIPILRFDDDVVFHGARDPSDPEAVQRTRKSIERLCEEYKRLSDDPEISYFAFSGSYLDSKTTERFETQNSELEGDEYLLHGLNGFATRAVQLAQCTWELGKALMKKHESLLEELPLDGPPSGETPKAKKLRETVDVVLKSEGIQLEVDAIAHFMCGLDKFGANPFLQVISGAGLCLSDSAILDLPPFSNMRQNVVWIDDHLKYSLHHELHHFGFCQDKDLVARVVDAPFQQTRHANPKALRLYDARWHLREYLPRLVLGCVADAWLRADVRLKRKLEGLSLRQFKTVFNEVPGTYAKRYFDVVIGGWPNVAAQRELRTDLWEKARTRLLALCSFFNHDEFRGTFLELFNSGPREPWKRLGFFQSIVPNGLEKAVESMPENMPQRLKRKKSSTKMTVHSLTEAVLVLMDDFVTYMDFASFWRHFVFAVRSLLNRKEHRKEALWLLPEPLPKIKAIEPVERTSKQQRKQLPRSDDAKDLAPTVIAALEDSGPGDDDVLLTNLLNEAAGCGKHCAKAIPRLLALAVHRKAPIRKLVAHALAEIGVRRKKVRSTLEDMVAKDRSKGVRAAANRALRKLWPVAGMMRKRGPS